MYMYVLVEVVDGILFVTVGVMYAKYAKCACH